MQRLHDAVEREKQVADRRQFQEVLFNLLRNAGQAIRPPGTITVRTHTGSGTHVRIEITDTGSGIPPEKLTKIYDPFFTTKDPGKGTGLGLAICGRLVESMGGRIRAMRGPDGGARFTIRLPGVQVTDASLAVPEGTAEVNRGRDAP